MSMTVGQAKIRDALKVLKAQWERCRESWDDTAREQFQREYIDPLDRCVTQAIGAIGRLNEAYSAARREVE